MGKYETLTLFTLLDTKKDQTLISEKKVVAKSNQPKDLRSSTFVTNKLKKYKNLALKEPSALEGVVNAKPMMEGENFIGYQLSPGIDSAFFRAAGLRRGDVLTSINGVKLDGPDKAFSLMASLALSSDLELIIDRGGEPMSFLYKFK